MYCTILSLLSSSFATVDSDKLGGPMTVEAVDLFLDKLGSANYGRLANYFKCIDTSPQTASRVALFLATPQKMARNTSLADSGVGSPSVWLESVNPSFGEASRSPTKGFGKKSALRLWSLWSWF